MVKQFLVVLMSGSDVKNFIVNCTNEISAKIIAQTINPMFRVIEVMENK